eukprot:4836570-Amphidinium_carterae.1
MHTTLLAGSRLAEQGFLKVEEPAGKPSGLVVFIAAWAGQTMADLADNRRWYREFDAGATIITMFTPHAAPATRSSLLGRVLEVMATTWGSQDASLIAHLFSNEGVQLWTHLLQSWLLRVKSPFCA